MNLFSYYECPLESSGEPREGGIEIKKKKKKKLKCNILRTIKIPVIRTELTSCPWNEDNFEIMIPESAHPIEDCIYIVMLIERINAPFIS